MKNNPRRFFDFLIRHQRPAGLLVLASASLVAVAVAGFLYAFLGADGQTSPAPLSDAFLAGPRIEKTAPQLVPAAAIPPAVTLAAGTTASRVSQPAAAPAAAVAAGNPPPPPPAASPGDGAGIAEAGGGQTGKDDAALVSGGISAGVQLGSGDEQDDRGSRRRQEADEAGGDD